MRRTALLAVAVCAVTCFWALLKFRGESEGGTAPRLESDKAMRLVCISDTHDYHQEIEIPDGDVLIHAGDFTEGGSASDIRRFNEWLGTLPHRNKIVIGGNMDFALGIMSKAEADDTLSNAIYLQDSQVEIDGYVFYGSPFTPKFVGVFQLYNATDTQEMISKIPDRVDVLITHGPPYGILDSPSSGGHVGCQALERKVMEIDPKIHVFGHIHNSYGSMRQGDKGTLFANVAQYSKFEGNRSCKPIVVDLP
ncbi:hypothetical protein NDN08_006723 [Rhodosorus marinus]|uniref:Calcineurin-like phosphoesterase domain-containing protein n=1 Tax=Rhodosorus marinus TaxID=101924 RepID=A0AAV8UII6_9RHOD|nr:hypothetical protein NDN08_006723 [Rhodosorus marinus]